MPALADHPAARGYLNTATIGLPPAATTAAMRADLDAWEQGRRQGQDYDAHVDAGRAAFARLVGVGPTDVAVHSQVSAAVAPIAASLPAGARVVFPQEDFTSLLFPFLVGDRLDARFVPLDSLAEAIDGDTALVGFSAAQSADGRVADLDGIAAAASHHGAMTLVDASQSAGWLPLDATRFDFVACAAYKWLLSPRGTAFLTVRPQRLDAIPPLLAGWFPGAERWGSTLYGPPLALCEGAPRLDVSPAWLSWVGTAPAIESLLDAGVEAIHAHDVALANRVRAGLDLEPSNTAFVTVEGPGVDDRLRAGGIAAAMRAGRVRLSFHLYNDESDADRVLEALSA